MAENSTVAIRLATLADADRVFEMLGEFVTSYRPNRDAFDRIFPELSASGEACLLVADESGKLRGYALALRVPTLFANGDTWYLQELFVDTAHRSRGIGTRLVDRVVDHARACGAVEVTVATRRAAEYYVRHGFTETAVYFKRKLRD